MNEYKVQLESRDDLTFLKDEMMKYFNENLTENIKISEASKQQVTIRLIFMYHFIDHLNSTLIKSFL